VTTPLFYVERPEYMTLGCKEYYVRKALQRLSGGTEWSQNLVYVAVASFLIMFGEGLVGGARTNFFVDVLKVSGDQVLRLEGLREIPGLLLMFLAALTMRMSVARQAAASIILLGLSYACYSLIGSYSALIAIAIVASLGMHLWFPLRSTLALSLSTRENSGRILGVLGSVGALAGMAGMGFTALTSGFFQGMSLRFSYVLGGAVICLAAVFLLKLPKDLGGTKKNQARMLVKRKYWLYYVLTFFEGSRKQVLGTFVALVLVDQYNLPTWQISTLLLVSSVINFFALPWLGLLLDRVGERRVLTTSYILLVLGCLGYATVNTVWVLALLMFVIKILVMLDMGLSSYLGRFAPDEELQPTLSTGISIANYWLFGYLFDDGGAHHTVDTLCHVSQGHLLQRGSGFDSSRRLDRSQARTGVDTVCVHPGSCLCHSQHGLNTPRVIVILSLQKGLCCLQLKPFA